MKVRQTRTQWLQLEALERREVLSMALGAPDQAGSAGQAIVGSQAGMPVHVFLATTKQTVLLKGSGKGQVTSATPLPHGGLRTISVLSGAVTPLGSFTGELVLDFAADHLHFKGQAVLVGTTSKTDQIKLDIVGSNRSPKTNTSFQATFTIMGGSGRFLHATGSGSLSGTANTLTGAASFTIGGKITF